MVDDAIIVKEYNEGKSGIEISNKYNISSSYVYKVLKRNNIKTRSNKINSRKYNFNQNYFDIIDTEEKAYWLGFLYADGYVTNDYFGIALKKDDIGHLEKFNKSISSNYPIHIYISKGYSEVEYCRLLLKSEYTVNMLIEKGLLRNKSKILKYPKCIPIQLYRHFIRGYVDGDGSIHKNGNTFGISIIGTPNMINWIMGIFNKEMNIPHSKLRKRNKDDIVVDCRYFGENCYKIINYLYKDSKIYLDRKMERYILANSFFCRLYQ